MTPLETHWDLGVLIGVPVWAVLVLATLAVTIGGLVLWRRDDDGEAAAFGVGAFICLLIWAAIIISPLGYWPFKAEYHQWRTVEGTVQQVSKRLVSQDKGFSERYVFVINGQPYGVDDTRASLVKAGDHVRLSCRREWQYASTPGYGCRWDQ